MIYKFHVGQLTASPYYSSGADALLELICRERLAMKIIGGDALKKGVYMPEKDLDARITTLRIPAGHWLMLSRAEANQELEISLRRVASGSDAPDPPVHAIENEAFVVANGSVFGIVRNGLNVAMSYRLVVRSDAIENNGLFHVQSGSELIVPTCGSFILDAWVPGGGKLEIGGLANKFAGFYDLFVAT